MAVGSPTSLANIVTEFGEGILSTQTFNSGSGSVTAPADASGVRIKVWGGGGGGYETGNEGQFGGGGGGGAFSYIVASVTGGSTTASYSVGAGGVATTGGNGGSSSVTIGATTLTAGGGFGGTSGSSGSGGTASGGSVNESGAASVNDSGGAAGGVSYGGGTGNGTAPGSGGVGGDFYSTAGASGRVTFEWLFKGLSTYARGTGEVPSHSANANIPTSTTNLAISQFNGAEKSFTATIISADISGTQNPPSSYATRGFEAGVYGSINRDQVGLSRNNTNTTTLLSWIETPAVYYDLLGNPSGYIFPATIKFSGDVRSSTLGYHFFTLAEFATQSFDGTNTTFTTIGGFTQTFGADGSSNPVTLIYGGP
jgi:hypothetical protein